LKNYLKRWVWHYKQSKNIAWLLALSAIIAISQFVVYRSIFIYCGERAMGVWALFAAVAALAQVTSFGFAPALLRLVTMQDTKQKRRNIGLLLATVNASNILVAFPLTLVLYWPAVWYGQSMLQGSDLENYLSILPAGILGLCLNNFSSAYLFMLDGFSLFYKRAIIQIVSYLLFAVLSFAGIQYFGVVGVSYAFFIQHVIIIVLSIWSTRELLNGKSIFPIRISKWAIKELFGFSAKMQVSNMLVICFDPLVKFFITTSIGLSGTAAYEIANKVVVQVRNIVAVSNQVITPMLVKKQIEEQLPAYYSLVFKKNQWISFILSLLLIGFTPFVSIFFVGEVRFEIMAAILVMNIAWFVNMIAIPGYYLFLAVNRLNVLILVHFINAFILIAGFKIFGDSVTINILAVLPAFAVFTGAIFNIMAANRYVKSKLLAPSTWILLGIGLAVCSLLLLLFSLFPLFDLIWVAFSFLVVASIILAWLAYVGKLAFLFNRNTS
jgi:O-antigen/teichoic acid export membrane protein